MNSIPKENEKYEMDLQTSQIAFSPRPSHLTPHYRNDMFHHPQSPFPTNFNSISPFYISPFPPTQAWGVYSCDSQQNEIFQNQNVARLTALVNQQGAMLVKYEAKLAEYEYAKYAERDVKHSEHDAKIVPTADKKTVAEKSQVFTKKSDGDDIAQNFEALQVNDQEACSAKEKNTEKKNTSKPEKIVDIEKPLEDAIILKMVQYYIQQSRNSPPKKIEFHDDLMNMESVRVVIDGKEKSIQKWRNLDQFKAWGDRWGFDKNNRVKVFDEDKFKNVHRSLYLVSFTKWVVWDAAARLFGDKLINEETNEIIKDFLGENDYNKTKLK